jgi:hypothetical protein
MKRSGFDLGDKAILGSMAAALICGSVAWYFGACEMNVSVNEGLVVGNYLNSLGPVPFSTAVVEDWRFTPAKHYRYFKAPSYCFDGMATCIEDRKAAVFSIE